jgi:AraC-like DNA-binding protein
VNPFDYSKEKGKRDWRVCMDNCMKQIKKDKQAERIYVIPDALIEEVKSHPLARPLYFSDIGCFENVPNHFRQRVNGCEQAIFIYCFKGSGYYVEEGKSKTVESGKLLFIAENTPHLYASSKEEPWSILWIHVNGINLSNYYCYQKHTMSLIAVPFEKQNKIRTLFEEIFGILEQGFQFENLLYTYQVLAHILGLFFLSPNYNKLSMRQSGPSIYDSINYMSESLQQQLTLKDLANHSRLSEVHYSYLFKKNTGYSPIHYFLRLKIQRACTYLDISDYPISEISELLGFKDSFYFSRLFHKIMGMSPSDYRKKQKG